MSKELEELREENKKLKERLSELEKFSSQIVWAFSTAVEAKDYYTGGHSQRVGEYAWRLSKKLGKSKEEQHRIYYAGLLHDIGKISIPDMIINKNGKLTDEEYARIKDHPAVGGSILHTITCIPDISVGAKWHHERYDGKGYPDGLKGDEIPEIARIIAVADTYDAMSSTRSYRAGMSQADVRAQIEKGKGTQFDPYIADKMLELIDEDTDYELHG